MGLSFNIYNCFQFIETKSFYSNNEANDYAVSKFGIEAGWAIPEEEDVRI